MRLWLAAVGRVRGGPIRELFDDYARRLSAPLGPLTLKEVEARRRGSPETVKREEGSLLLAALPQRAPFVALDERGAALTSRELADRLSRWVDDGVSDLGFTIGGADGLDDSVRRQAAMTLAFGSMTWPHLLVRVMLGEQLYRASTILSGHPYHRG